MRLDLTLVATDPAALREARAAAREAVAAAGLQVKGEVGLGPAALDIHLEADARRSETALTDLKAGLAGPLDAARIDFAVQPPQARRRRLFLADMDSTIVGCECLDELADFAGVKAEVAAVTERSMRGEMNFEAALRLRVALLKGLPATALDRCFDERVRLNPGALTLLATLRNDGVRCVLVSGEFRPFTTRAAALAGFHAERGNAFLIRDGALTGEVAEPILGPSGKREALRAEALEAGVALEAALCVGDGANDLEMIQAAGLGVAYRAKPVLAAAADARIEHTDLTTLLYFQGYAESAFVDPKTSKIAR